MSANYLDTIITAYENVASYLWKIVTTPFPEKGINGFYFLIFVSLAIWGLELLLPWRKNQKTFRKDFWLDGFYMFFNFYIFQLLIYAALSSVGERAFWIFSEYLDMKEELSRSFWIKLGIATCDFVPFIRFGSMDNSRDSPSCSIPLEGAQSASLGKEMGFAAHLRYHFFETFVYQTGKYIFLSLLFGFSFENAFIVYSFTVLIGHLNHANLGWDYGPLKYILNNPKMHIWHHVKELPKEHPHGMNFGISLSIWDYLFKTAYVPSSGRDIELGFPDDENYPQGFGEQLIQPFKSEK